jgi:hypothetical protein
MSSNSSSNSSTKSSLEKDRNYYKHKKSITAKEIQLKEEELKILKKQKDLYKKENIKKCNKYCKNKCQINKINDDLELLDKKVERYREKLKIVDAKIKLKELKNKIKEEKKKRKDQKKTKSKNNRHNKDKKSSNSEETEDENSKNNKSYKKKSTWSKKKTRTKINLNLLATTPSPTPSPPPPANKIKEEKKSNKNDLNSNPERAVPNERERTNKLEGLNNIQLLNNYEHKYQFHNYFFSGDKEEMINNYNDKQICNYENCYNYKFPFNVIVFEKDGYEQEYGSVSLNDLIYNSRKEKRNHYALLLNKQYVLDSRDFYFAEKELKKANSCEILSMFFKVLAIIKNHEDFRYDRCVGYSHYDKYLGKKIYGCWLCCPQEYPEHLDIKAIQLACLEFGVDFAALNSF